MLHKVLKPFPYSADGKFTRDLVEGEMEEIREDLAPGLIEAKLIGKGQPSGEAREAADKAAADKAAADKAAADKAAADKAAADKAAADKAAADKAS